MISSILLIVYGVIDWITVTINSVIDPLLLIANAVICVLTAGRLMFYQKTGRFHFWLSLLAYGMILACAWTAFRIGWGQYTQVDAGEILMNFFLCVAVWRAGGNIAKIAGETGDKEGL